MAGEVAEAVGIRHFQANMRPEDKLAFVERYNQSHQDHSGSTVIAALLAEGVRGYPFYVQAKAA